MRIFSLPPAKRKAGGALPKSWISTDWDSNRSLNPSRTCHSIPAVPRFLPGRPPRQCPSCRRPSQRAMRRAPLCRRRSSAANRRVARPARRVAAPPPPHTAPRGPRRPLSPSLPPPESRRLRDAGALQLKARQSWRGRPPERK